MTKHTPTPWGLSCVREGYAQLVGDISNGCCSTILHIDVPIKSQLWDDFHHAVKCVNEHEALKERVSALEKQNRELVEGIKELDTIELRMTMRSFNPIKRAIRSGSFERTLMSDLHYGQESVDDVIDDYHKEGLDHQKLCATLLAKHTTKEGE